MSAGDHDADDDEWEDLTAEDDAAGDGPFTPPECQRCGACCHSEHRFHVWVSGGDHARMTLEEQRRLTVFDGTWCYMRMEDGHCAALAIVDGLWTCTIYERRPFLCRDFARGSPQCRHDVEAKGARTAARLLPLARGSGAGAEPAAAAPGP